MSHTHPPSRAQDVATLAELERRRLRALAAGDNAVAGDICWRVVEPTSDLAVLVSGDHGAGSERRRIEIEASGTVSSIDGWHTDLSERIDGA